MRCDLPGRDSPVVDPPGSGQVEEAAVEVRAAPTVAPGERVPPVSRNRRRRAVAGKRQRQYHGDQEHRRCDEGSAQPPPCSELPPLLDHVEGERRERCEDDQDHGEHCDRVAVLLRGAQGRAGVRERIGPGCEVDRDRRPGRDHRCRDCQLRPSTVDDERRCQACEEGDPAPAAEREIQRQREHDRRGSRGRPHDRAAARRQAECEQAADRREQSQAVPVADRRRETVGRDRVEDPELPRKQSRQKRVRADRSDPEPGAEDDRSAAGAPAEEERDHDAAHVHEAALPLEEAARDADRPDGGRERPGRQACRGGENQLLDGPQPRRAGDRQQNDGNQTEPDRSPAPRGREVAAVVGGKARDGGERDGCRHDLVADDAFRQTQAVLSDGRQDRIP